jgi:hypothetical protein
MIRVMFDSALRNHPMVLDGAGYLDCESIERGKTKRAKRNQKLRN